MIQELDFWDSQPDENAISESQRSPNVNTNCLNSLWAKTNNVAFLTSYYVLGTDSVVGSTGFFLSETTVGSMTGREV